MCKKNKKTTAADIMASHADMFKCPLCSGRMNVANRESLFCVNNHCFDISKYGYVNLLSRAVATRYDKRLFDSRRVISNIGFFKPVHRYISRQIAKALEAGCEPLKVLDAGCGEGSHLSQIQEMTFRDTRKEVLGVGLDLSKEGIVLASKHAPGSIWCVADLARCPLADEQFPIILSILAPSNYSEFQRLLAHGGKVIKVIPEHGYLQELRSLYGKRPGKQTHSSGDTRERFSNYFEVTDSQRLQYKVTLNHALLPCLTCMTPLSWEAKPADLQKVLAMNEMEVTVDLTVLVGERYR